RRGEGETALPYGGAAGRGERLVRGEDGLEVGAHAGGAGAGGGVPELASSIAGPALGGHPPLPLAAPLRLSPQPDRAADEEDEGADDVSARRVRALSDEAVALQGVDLLREGGGVGDGASTGRPADAGAEGLEVLDGDGGEDMAGRRGPVVPDVGEGLGG